MFAAKTRGERVLLKRIVDRRLWLEEIFERQRVRLDEFPKREGFDEVGDGGHLLVPVLAIAMHFPSKTT